MSSQTIKQEIQAKGVTMLPHQESVIVERAELHEKLTKLLAFMNTGSFEALPDRDRYLLNKQASFLDFVHNVGAAAFSGSTMRRKLLAGDMIGACHENEKWVYGTINKVKTVLPGLLTRRGANSDLCANGL